MKYAEIGKIVEVNRNTGNLRKHFVKIHEIQSQEFNTLEQSMRETLAMVLISPQFLYHTTIKNSVTSKQDELASRLSYYHYLWNSIPDKELFDW